MTELALIVKATAVLGTAVTAAWIARRQRAAVRYLLLASGFGVLLLLPLAAAVSPKLVVEVPFAAAVSVPGVTPAGPVPAADIDAAMAPAASGAPIGSSAGRERVDAVAVSWLQVLRVAWALGVLLCLVPMVTALGRVRDLRRHGWAWPGGEVLARQVAAAVGVRRHVSVLLHQDVAVPMACGLARPTVLLPSDAPGWTEADLRQTLLHELEHVRRADWPAFVAARLACAIWWFHPLAWTAWHRLCLEAERACDDAVLRSADRRAYAAQLVRLADRLVARSPSPAPAMATFGDLSVRVKAVLSESQARGRAGASWAAGLAVSVVLVLVSIAPLTLGAAGAAAAQDLESRTQAGERFENVTLRAGTLPLNQPIFDVQPGDPVGTIHSPHTLGFAATGASVETLIRWAYGIGDDRGIRPADDDWREGPVPFGWVEGVPDWDEVYDVRAKTPQPYVVPPAGELGEVHEMVRTLLAERFQLEAHWETRQVENYELTLAEEGLGPRIRPSPDCPFTSFPERSQFSTCRQTFTSSGASGVQDVTMRRRPLAVLVASLQHQLGRPLIDRTGLEGELDLELIYLSGSLRGDTPPADPVYTRLSRSLPSLADALRDQLGLRLESRPSTENVLVIDRMERPVLDP